MLVRRRKLHPRKLRKTEMKICRIAYESSAHYAIIRESSVFPLPAGYNFENVSIPDQESALAFDEVKLLAPVVPSKIVCVGRNYREHAAELGNKCRMSRCSF